jgi:subtilisin family serine protease
MFVRFPGSQPREVLTGKAVKSSPEKRKYHARTNQTISILDLTDDERSRLEGEGCSLYRTVEFELFEKDRPSASRPPFSYPYSNRSVADILEAVDAPRAWEKTTGKGATIAVVDTGVAGGRAEFREKGRHFDIESYFFKSHWTDFVGHGSMCAAIACAKAGEGAKYNGVAPDAELISARARINTDDIYVIYEQLILWKRDGVISGPLIINNSYGLAHCAPLADMAEEDPFIDLVKAAVSSGIVVVFAAGNNHSRRCGFDARNNQPNSIWAANSLDEVLSVGAIDWNNSNCDSSTPHSDSSRGPGQWARLHKKPDCVAPCYGEALWGDEYKIMPWWGTSGTAPQVAGLAALLLSQEESLAPGRVADIIRDSCKPLTGHEFCVGRGTINCHAALSLL